MGNSWTLTTILDSFLDKSIISQNEVGYLGLVYIFSGTAAGIIASIFLELKKNSKNYVDPLIKILSTISTIFLVNLKIEKNLKFSIDFSLFFKLDIIGLLCAFSESCLAFYHMCLSWSRIDRSNSLGMHFSC